MPRKATKPPTVVNHRVLEFGQVEAIFNEECRGRRRVNKPDASIINALVLALNRPWAPTLSREDDGIWKMRCALRELLDNGPLVLELFKRSGSFNPKKLSPAHAAFARLVEAVRDLKDSNFGIPDADETAPRKEQANSAWHRDAYRVRAEVEKALKEAGWARPSFTTPGAPLSIVRRILAAQILPTSDTALIKEFQRGKKRRTTP